MPWSQKEAFREKQEMKYLIKPEERIYEDFSPSHRGHGGNVQHMLRRQEYNEGNMEWKSLLVKPQSTIGSILAYHSGEMLRRLGIKLCAYRARNCDQVLHVCRL